MLLPQIRQSERSKLQHQLWERSHARAAARQEAELAGAMTAILLGDQGKVKAASAPRSKRATRGVGERGSWQQELAAGMKAMLLCERSEGCKTPRCLFHLAAFVTASGAGPMAVFAMASHCM